jgi:hypothetical protein
VVLESDLAVDPRAAGFPMLAIFSSRVEISQQLGLVVLESDQVMDHIPALQVFAVSIVNGNLSAAGYRGA